MNDQERLQALESQLRGLAARVQALSAARPAAQQQVVVAKKDDASASGQGARIASAVSNLDVGTATLGDVATKVNELLAALRGAGMMGV